MAEKQLDKFSRMTEKQLDHVNNLQEKKEKDYDLTEKLIDDYSNLAWK
jgi:hypothetical protein